MNSTTIENILANWGRAERQLPPSNLALKSQILEKFNIPLAPTAPKKISKMPWLSLACAGLAVVVLLLQIPGKKLPQPVIFEPLTSGVPQKQSAIAEKQKPAEQDAFKTDSVNKTMRAPLAGALSAEQSQNNTPQIYLPPKNQEIPVSDSREYLKTSYSASLQSRHVTQLGQRIETAVRGFGGRVDSSNLSKENGLISFVVPADKFESFRMEVKNLAGEKFLVENLNSENLLPDKKSIEQHQLDAQAALVRLSADSEKLTADHNRAINSLKSQLAKVAQELKNLDSQFPPWSDAYSLKQQELFAQRRGLQEQLDDENSNYQYNLNSLNEQMWDNQQALKNLGGQNTNLLNTAATVRGTIAIEKIGFLQFVNAYFAVYWIIIILLALAAMAYIFQRRNRLIIP